MVFIYDDVYILGVVEEVDLFFCCLFGGVWDGDVVEGVVVFIWEGLEVDEGFLSNCSWKLVDV